jgi:hypothetical protein
VVRFRSRIWRTIPPEKKVFIARPSKLGNPFRIGVDGDRSEVIAKYRAHIHASPELMALARAQRGKLLGCFCAPLACHGDVIAEIADTPDGYFIPVTIPIHHRLREYKLRNVVNKEVRSHLVRGRRCHSWRLTLACEHVVLRPARALTEDQFGKLTDENYHILTELDVKPAGLWRRAPKKVRCTICPLRD